MDKEDRSHGQKDITHSLQALRVRHRTSEGETVGGKTQGQRDFSRQVWEKGKKTKDGSVWHQQNNFNSPPSKCKKLKGWVGGSPFGGGGV